jgi:hypothetical protein
MLRRSERSQTLTQLRLMYADARRSALLRDQESEAIRRRIIALRIGYRGSARARLHAALTEQVARDRLAAQAGQNVAAMAHSLEDALHDERQ